MSKHTSGRRAGTDKMGSDYRPKHGATLGSGYKGGHGAKPDEIEYKNPDGSPVQRDKR